MSIYLKKELQGVVKVDIGMGPNEGNSGPKEQGRPKCLDQGDARYKGGTCLVHDGLCSMKVDEAMTFS